MKLPVYTLSTSMMYGLIAVSMPGVAQVLVLPIILMLLVPAILARRNGEPLQKIRRGR